jgi:hypothetical protein
MTMDKDTKKKCLEYLASSKFYSDALQNVPDESERKKIKVFAEEFYINFMEGLLAIKKVSEEHPEKLAEAIGKRIPNNEKK